MTTKQREFYSLVKENVDRCEWVEDSDWDQDILVRATDDGMVLSCFVNKDGEITGDWF